MQELRLAPNLVVIPPKGLIEKVIPEIKLVLDGRLTVLPRDLDIPKRAPFELEMVVDDECVVCPEALKMVADIARRHPNISVVVYNATYVKPPFDTEMAPAFRVNKTVTFSGVPIDAEQAPKWFEHWFVRAYVKTHPRLEELVNRLKEFAQTHGFVRCPSDTHYLQLVYRLLRNWDELGAPFCPCRPLEPRELVEKARTVGLTEEEKQRLLELNRDRVCPCPYAKTEVLKLGRCTCGLFWSREAVDRWLEQVRRERGWIVARLEKLKHALDELERRVLVGGAKEVADAIISELEKLYPYLPD